MSHPSIRVLLVEDHAMVRDGLVALLSGTEDIEPVGGAGSSAEALAMTESLQPDVVVLDVGLPDLDGVETARQIRAAEPQPGVVMLTMYDDPAMVERALRAGARGYVLKGRAIDNLCSAIRTVAAGGTHLDEAVSEAVLGGLLRGQGERDPLTDRERDILRGIADGFTSAEVAEQLGLKTKTVQNYRSQIMDKLGIHTTAGLVRYALRSGLTR